ncbi:MAG: energy transducer TonB [Leptospiraceae bacterium]|nr:energy transducer TonB [Leptospiraceae bacterium]MDW7977134.1 energy transducer TonB [Leptospiraceae bacterium]
MSTIAMNNIQQNTQDFRRKSPAQRTFFENLKIKFYQNRFLIFGTLSTIVQIWFIATAYIPNVEILQEKKVYDEITFITNIQLADPQMTTQTEAQGEVKETDKIIKKEEEQEDPRIASAQNVFLIGATIPIDLTPEIRPEYPMEARKNGIEGTVTLELVIADTGEVLKVVPINKPLGYGLEESAVRAFRKKRYQPALMDGKPITVRVIVPVHFRLN